MKILAISSSLRSGSQNTALLRAAAEEAPRDVELELWEGLKEIPAFDEDDELDPPATVEVFRDAVRNADGVLIATPEVWAQAELRKVLAAMGGRVAEVELAVGHGHGMRDEHGNLIDGTVRQELRDSVSTLVALTLESVAAAA